MNIETFGTLIEQEEKFRLTLKSKSNFLWYMYMGYVNITLLAILVVLPFIMARNDSMPFVIQFICGTFAAGSTAGFVFKGISVLNKV